MLSYLGAIFLGPFAPLGVFIARRQSGFVRMHAVQALNLTLTCLLFGISGAIIGGLLALDSTNAALLIMLPLATVGWLIMLTQLVRGAVAASHGRYRELPRWIAATIVR
jgi:uncharacterized membrane protein